jgi:hypothetical protein
VNKTAANIVNVFMVLLEAAAEPGHADTGFIPGG